MSTLRSCALILLLAAALPAQTTPPSITAGPTYFSITGARFSYYDNVLTETTNFGIRVSKLPAATPADPSTPAYLWAVISVDATPRSQASTAALRAGARYFLTSAAGHNVIVYANAQAGAVSTSTPIPGSASSLLGNLQGGMGIVWRACHTFNKNAGVNCIVDLDYELNSVTSQAVKPIVGLFVGLAF